MVEVDRFRNLPPRSTIWRVRREETKKLTVPVRLLIRKDFMQRQSCTNHDYVRDDLRQYLRGLSSMLLESARSNDPRVIRLGLQVVLFEVPKTLWALGAGDIN